MPNTTLTSTQVTRKALQVLHQKLNFVGSITREYDDRFANDGAKIGDTLKIRLPNQYVVTSGATLVTQDTTESSIDLKINSQKHVGMNFTSQDLTLSLDDFSDRIIDPAMAVLAASVEADALSMYKDIYQQQNNQTLAANFAKFLAARKMLVDSLTPPASRSVCLNTQDNVDMVADLKGLFNPQERLAKMVTEGYLGRTAGFDFLENTLLSTHPRGAGNGSYTTDTRTSALPLVSTAVTSITVASGTGALNKGDIFTVGTAVGGAGILRVHPETKQSTGQLQQFTVAADYAGGGGAVSISPGIVLAGAFQNVVIPATSATAAVNVAGTASTPHGISLAYHKQAFAFATADLVMPKGVDFGAREVFDGISLRIVRQYDINNDKLPCRVDILYGYKTIRPQLAVRVANN